MAHYPKLAPANFKPQATTVWSFQDRGDWATHKEATTGATGHSTSPNLILRYIDKNDTILNQMTGSGTTLVECKLHQRKAIGVDINPDAVMVTPQQA